MKVLAVGAHPDDVELGCFGTLLELQRLGHTVHAVALAPGAYGSHSRKDVDAAWRVSHDALTADGKSTYRLGEFPIGLLAHSWETVGYVDRLLEELDIDTIITHHYGESHQDHMAAEKIAVSAARRHVRSLFLWESVLYTHRNFSAFRPQVYVPVSDAAFQVKAKTLNAYAERGLLREEEVRAHEHLARYRGSEIHHEYAEAFEVVWQTLSLTSPAD